MPYAEQLTAQYCLLESPANNLIHCECCMTAVHVQLFNVLTELCCAGGYAVVKDCKVHYLSLLATESNTLLEHYGHMAAIFTQ